MKLEDLKIIANSKEEKPREPEKLVSFKISEEIKQKALEVAKKIKEKKEGLSSSILSKGDLNITGILGEWLYRGFLEYKGIKYIYHGWEIIERHYSDTEDFTIGKVKVDVKATSKYDTIVLNEGQRNKAIKMGIDLLVGVKVYEGSNFGYLQGRAKTSDLVLSEKKFNYNGEEKKMYEIPEDKLTRYDEDLSLII